MKKLFPRIAAFLAVVSPLITQAQMHADTAAPADPTPAQKLYLTGAMDGAIFSSAIMQKTGEAQKWTTLRFSYFLNFGYNLNYDFSNNVGLYTGLGIKNIGFIEKVERPGLEDSTIKRRVYTIGIPLGLKIGNFEKKNFVFIGGGADVPFNYREKGFVNRRDKEKFSEWFTDRTPLLMPYMFAGFSIKPGVSFKVQYYPNSFLNANYRDKEAPRNPDGSYQRPYKNYAQLNLVMVSVGFNMDFKKKDKAKKMEEESDDAPAPAQM